MNTNFENDKNNLVKCNNCNYGLRYEMQVKSNGEKLKDKICIQCDREKYGIKFYNIPSNHAD